jgi:hypothetical protein
MKIKSAIKDKDLYVVFSSKNNTQKDNLAKHD